MTITLAIYAPIGFMHNQAANIFRSFAFTFAGVVSGFIVLTLISIMCSRFLKADVGSAKGYAHFIEEGTEGSHL